MNRFKYRLHVIRMKYFSAMAPQWQMGHPDEWSNEEMDDYIWNKEKQ